MFLARVFRIYLFAKYLQGRPPPQGFSCLDGFILSLYPQDPCHQDGHRGLSHDLPITHDPDQGIEKLTGESTPFAYELSNKAVTENNQQLPQEP